VEVLVQADFNPRTITRDNHNDQIKDGVSIRSSLKDNGEISTPFSGAKTPVLREAGQVLSASQPVR
jgi:hypothetical protein